jgi:hypothetical protein
MDIVPVQESQHKDLLRLDPIAFSHKGCWVMEGLVGGSSD